MREMDQIDQHRRRMMWIAVVGLATWRGLHLASELIHGATGLKEILTIVGLVGWVLFVVALVWNWRIARRLKAQPSLQAQLDDEFVRYARLRAFSAAFWAVLITQVVVLLANTFHPLPANVGPDLTLLVGVTFAMGTFLTTGKAPEDA